MYIYIYIEIGEGCALAHYKTSLYSDIQTSLYLYIFEICVYIYIYIYIYNTYIYMYIFIHIEIGKGCALAHYKTFLYVLIKTSLYIYFV